MLILSWSPLARLRNISSNTFENLPLLVEVEIIGCSNLSFISDNTFTSLESLKRLIILESKSLCLFDALMSLSRSQNLQLEFLGLVRLSYERMFVCPRIKDEHFSYITHLPLVELDISENLIDPGVDFHLDKYLPQTLKMLRMFKCQFTIGDKSTIYTNTSLEILDFTSCSPCMAYYGQLPNSALEVSFADNNCYRIERDFIPKQNSLKNFNFGGNRLAYWFPVQNEESILNLLTNSYIL